MNIEPSFTALRISQAGDGSLLLAVIGRHEIVRGVKAFYTSEHGERGDFLVSVGPFVGEHGARPIVYPAEDVLGGWVIDVSEMCRLAPSLAPDDLALQDAQAVQSKKIWGEVLLCDAGTFMRVANFGRAGAADDTYLNVESGELADLPERESYLTTGRWRLIGPGADGAIGTLVDFTAQAS